jgi:hypothetical protein
VERISSASNADRERNAAIISKLTFEEGYLLPENKVAPLDNSSDRRFYFS